ncbi:hypothetical protein [Bacillus sp. FDAARGOS_1420]|uniref:hypothetical protein n=1 Tax=unclassified Bacillus (in: firmicutes) TaxID=185979 RepID=UPI001C5B2D2A|nr:hypothetical protein [Bacillus sp. FDAARGOS_1420]MBW3496656.1 hypothetical protein [Bacillus sp. FDAARGOS_1420]
MNIGVSEWKALKQETKLKLLRNAALQVKISIQNKTLHLQSKRRVLTKSDRKSIGNLVHSLAFTILSYLKFRKYVYLNLGGMQFESGSVSWSFDERS